MPKSHVPTQSKYLQGLANPANHTAPLKRSLSGYEIEMPLINEQGAIQNDSDKILAECRKLDKKFPIQEEVAKSMIELSGLPHSRVQKTALYFINNVKKTLDICEKHNLSMLPLGTYPGKQKTELRLKQRYVYSALALGKDKYMQFYPRCFGFHFHYTLPRGVFNKKTKFLNNKYNSRIKTTLLDSYNFLIAADPALTTFCQSSPFEGGKYYAKDTRLLYWRGGPRLKFDGMFSKHQSLGALQPYKQTLSDLIHSLERKDKKGRELFAAAGVAKSFLDKKPKLDLIWNPVKINKLGTLEQRGLDTNHLDICLAVSIMAKFVMRAIQQEFYHVIPSDIGLDEPFKLEGNVIFIPPHSHVRSILQPKSAYAGLSDAEVHKYCSRFFQLAKKLLYTHYMPIVKPISQMLDNKQTVSDEIIAFAKKKGHKMADPLSQDIAKEIALWQSQKLSADIDRVKANFENLVE